MCVYIYISISIITIYKCGYIISPWYPHDSSQFCIQYMANYSSGWWFEPPWNMMEFVNFVRMTSHFFDMENNPVIFETTRLRASPPHDSDHYVPKKNHGPMAPWHGTMASPSSPSEPQRLGFDSAWCCWKSPCSLQPGGGIPRRNFWHILARFFQNHVWSHWKSQLIYWHNMEIWNLWNLWNIDHYDCYTGFDMFHMFRACAGSFNVSSDPSPERWSHQLRWLPRWVPKSSKSLDEFRRWVLKPMVTSGIPHHLPSGYLTYGIHGPVIDGLPIKNCDFPWLC